MQIQITECTNSDYNRLARAITKFNLEHLPPHSSDNMFEFGFVIKRPIWGLVAGITGKLLLGNVLSIDMLWVDEKQRHKGYASQLIVKLEDEARKRGSKLAQVDTFDFQALGFYEKHGYTIFGVLENSPCAGNKRYYLKKPLV